MRSGVQGATTVKLRYLMTAGHWPSGNPRLYYRPRGQKAVPMPDLPRDHPLFVAAYLTACGLTELPPAAAETGTDLYCELCDSQSARRDADLGSFRNCR